MLKLSRSKLYSFCANAALIWNKWNALTFHSVRKFEIFQDDSSVKYAHLVLMILVHMNSAYALIAACPE